MQNDQKLSFLEERIERGDLREVFALLYFDLTGTGSQTDFWQQSSFQAAVNHHAVVEPQGWVNGRSLKQHYNKHGKKEFKLTSKDDYLRMAMEFFRNEEGPTILIRQQGSGEFFKYNFETNELGVLSADLRIITYYILDPKFRPQEEFEGSLADQLLR